MRIDESVDWGCGCWIMKEFDTHITIKFNVEDTREEK